jgi:hypothetical protein
MPPSINLRKGIKTMDMNAKQTQQPETYTPPAVLVAWLKDELGRAAHFERVDPILHAPIISKIKNGRIPVTFEYAIRLERAQKPSDKPFTADQIMTYEQDKELYRYISGQEPAPPYVPHVRATKKPKAAA